MSNLPVFSPNPALNYLCYLLVYLGLGVYFTEQIFHPFRDGECPGDETNERLIMFLAVLLWPVVVVSMSIGMALISVYRFFHGLRKLVSKFFSS